MEIINNWLIQIVIYLLSVVVYTQTFKQLTKSAKNDGILTIILEIVTSTVLIIFIPFFEMKWQADFKVYLFTLLAIIFYCIKDRTTTTVRKHIQASTVNILDQVTNIFMMIWGIIFFKEEIVFKKIIGALLIILSNVMIFYEKGNFKFDKYVLLGILSNLSLSIALCLNVDNSENFNIAIYQMITLLIPSILIFTFERIKVKDIKKEFKILNKKHLIITSISWALMIISQLRAYQTAEITTVAPLCAISVILNVFAGYIFQKERNKIFTKIVAAILIIVSVILIKL